VTLAETVAQLRNGYTESSYSVL